MTTQDPQAVSGALSTAQPHPTFEELGVRR